MARNHLTHWCDGTSRMEAVVASVAAGNMRLSGRALPGSVFLRLAHAAGVAEGLNLPPERRPREHLWKLPESLEAPADRVAAVRRAVSLAEQLLTAAFLLCDPSVADHEHKAQLSMVEALWAKSLGKKDSAHTARMELVEALWLVAGGICSADHALQVYTWFWPEHGEGLSRTDFDKTVEEWHRARSIKSAMPAVCRFLRSAGLSPPAAESLAQDWSRWRSRATRGQQGETA